MSRGEVKIRHCSGPMLVICDVCDVAKRDAGAVRIERSDHAGPYIATICDECAIEISHAMIRRYITPDAEPLADGGFFSVEHYDPIAARRPSTMGTVSASEVEQAAQEAKK